MAFRGWMVVSAFSLVSSAALTAASARAGSGKAYVSEGMKYEVEVLLEADGVLWGFDFLPDGNIVASRRAGDMFVFDVRTGERARIDGVPAVAAVGQGGLLDVRVHPDFKRNHWIYFTYSERVGDKMTTALGRGALRGRRLEGVKKLFSGHAPGSRSIHFGSRVEFSGPYVFVSVGDRDERAGAQDLGYHNGKVMRLNADGSPAEGNPFVGADGARPEIWTYGHRNPQGLARHPATGEIWEAEMGPLGGDEVNVLKKGANYGWPVVTYGREYSGERIGAAEKAGMAQPVVHWTPSISPSAIAFYDGDVFPKWKGDLFVGALSGAHLRRLTIDGGKVVAQEEMLKDRGERFRNVRQGPDGALYYSTDAGRLSRLVPVGSARSGRFTAPGERRGRGTK